MIKTLETPQIRAIKRSTGETLGIWHLTDYNATNCIKNLFLQITEDVISKGVMILGMFRIPDKVFRRFGLSGIIIDIPTKYSYLIAEENEDNYPFILDFYDNDTVSNTTRFIVRKKNRA